MQKTQHCRFCVCQEAKFKSQILEAIVNELEKGQKRRKGYLAIQNCNELGHANCIAQTYPSLGDAKNNYTHLFKSESALYIWREQLTKKRSRKEWCNLDTPSIKKMHFCEKIFFQKMLVRGYDLFFGYDKKHALRAFN